MEEWREREPWSLRWRGNRRRRGDWRAERRELMSGRCRACGPGGTQPARVVASCSHMSRATGRSMNPPKGKNAQPSSATTTEKDFRLNRMGTVYSGQAASALTVVAHFALFRWHCRADAAQGRSPQAPRIVFSWSSVLRAVCAVRVEGLILALGCGRRRERLDGASGLCYRFASFTVEEPFS